MTQEVIELTSMAFDEANIEAVSEFSGDESESSARIGGLLDIKLVALSSESFHVAPTFKDRLQGEGIDDCF